MEVAGLRLVLDHASVHRKSWSLAANGVFSPGIHLVSGDVGSGKSTLALMMAGLYAPESGAARREEISRTMLSFQFPEFHVTGLSVAEECASWNLSPENAIDQAGIDISPETPALALSRGSSSAFTCLVSSPVIMTCCCSMNRSRHWTAREKSRSAGRSAEDPKVSP